jgi:predicted HicB family RNase H-like nuclease
MTPTIELLAKYTVEVTPLPEEDGGGYKAIYKELAFSASGYGPTPVDAVQDLAELAEDLYSDEPIANMPVPYSTMPSTDFSGRVTLRLTKSLHYRLDRLAEQEGVSLNALLNDILQSGATALESGSTFGAVKDATPMSEKKTA